MKGQGEGDGAGRGFGFKKGYSQWSWEQVVLNFCIIICHGKKCHRPRIPNGHRNSVVEQNMGTVVLE